MDARTSGHSSYTSHPQPGGECSELCEVMHRGQRVQYVPVRVLDEYTRVPSGIPQTCRNRISPEDERSGPRAVTSSSSSRSEILPVLEKQSAIWRAKPRTRAKADESRTYTLQYMRTYIARRGLLLRPRRRRPQRSRTTRTASGSLCASKGDRRALGAL